MSASLLPLLSENNLYNTGRVHIWGFTNDDLVKILSNQGAAQTLKALVAHYEKLLAVQFSHDEITTMSRQRGASKTLTLVGEQYQNFVNGGLSKHEIVKLASQPCASKFLLTVLDPASAPSL